MSLSLVDRFVRLFIDEQEQAEGRQTIYRLANLIHDDGVSTGKLQEVLKQISTSTSDPEEAQVLKEKVTDEELRAFLLDAKKLVDDQEVPPDAPRINVAVDFTRIVDEAIAQPQP